MAALLQEAAASNAHSFKRSSNVGFSALKYPGGRFSVAELPTVRILRIIPFPMRDNIKVRFPSFSDTAVDWSNENLV